MKVGEIFIALGIDSTKFTEGLKSAKKDLLVFTAEITGALYAIDRFVESSTRGAIALGNFTLQTGLSADKLQHLQMASTLSNVAISADDVTASVRNLQSALVEIRMGRGNVLPFQLLGIDISKMDAFDVIDQLRDKIKNLDPAVAGNLIKQMGLNEGMLNALKMSREEFDKLGNSFIRTGRTVATLEKVGKAINTLKMNFSFFKDNLVASMEPALEKLIKFLYGALHLFESLSYFVGMLAKQWNSLSEATRDWIKVLGVALYTILSPIRAMLIGILLLIDDFVAYKRGGKSVIGMILGDKDKSLTDAARERTGIKPDVKPENDNFHGRMERLNKDGMEALKAKVNDPNRRGMFSTFNDWLHHRSDSDRVKAAKANTPLPGDKDVYYPPQPGIPNDINIKLKNLQDNNAELQRTQRMLVDVKRMQKLNPDEANKAVRELFDDGKPVTTFNNTFNIHGGDAQENANAVGDKLQKQFNYGNADQGNGKVY